MSESLNQEIGKTIRELRTKRKKTQAEIRTAAGLSAGFFSDIENGKRGIGAVNLLSIADALGVSIVRLIPKNWRDYLGACSINRSYPSTIDENTACRHKPQPAS